MTKWKKICIFTCTKILSKVAKRQYLTERIQKWHQSETWYKTHYNDKTTKVGRNHDYKGHYLQGSASPACVGSQFIWWHKVTAEHQPHLLVLSHNLSSDTRLLQNISLTCLCWVTIYSVTYGYCRTLASFACVGSQFIRWHKVTAEHQPQLLVLVHNLFRDTGLLQNISLTCLCWVTIYPVIQGYCRTSASLACVGSQFIWWHKTSNLVLVWT